MSDYKAFAARLEKHGRTWKTWQNLLLPQNGENSSVERWSPMKCIPNTSHPSYKSLWLPISELLPGRLSWGHCITSAWSFLSASPLGFPHSPLIPPAKWLHSVLPGCSAYIFFPSFWNKLRTALPSHFPPLWLSCKKPVGCCTWSRTVNTPLIMEGGICCKGHRKQQPQGKKCSFTSLLLSFENIFTGKFHSLLPPTFSYHHSAFVFFFPSVLIHGSLVFSYKTSWQNQQPQSAELTH